MQEHTQESLGRIRSLLASAFQQMCPHGRLSMMPSENCETGRPGRWPMTLYLERAPDIDGWVLPLQITAMRTIAALQANHCIAGSIGEIGVHHGRVSKRGADDRSKVSQLDDVLTMRSSFTCCRHWPNEQSKKWRLMFLSTRQATNLCPASSVCDYQILIPMAAGA